jgi:immune inhibitor A
VKKKATSLGAGTAATLGLTMGLMALTALQPATAVDTTTPARAEQAQSHREDNRPGPLTAKQEKLKQKALTMLSNGSAELEEQPGGGATVELSDGTAVEFPTEKQEKVWTVLSEFGTQTAGRYGRTPGPLHNEIPQPDRATDNSTIWTEDFSKAHFEKMFNGPTNSFADYYAKVSGGKYTAINTVEDWVKVPYNGSYYGANPREDEGGSWAFITDSINSWYAAQQAAGKSPAEIDAYLAQFDEWDRYDFDSDGNFNEGDGYIDHFQAVHAGEGEEAGASADAIWSHRWYVNGNLYGQTGPSVDGTANLLGGSRVGDSKFFVGDYTVEPENGGLGVFAHEFGHDLGLPDYYDTDGGENGTAFWTLMSSGSWLNDGTVDIGSLPGLMGPEEKLYLGWLDHAEVNLGQSGTYQLSPSQNTVTGQEQAVKVNLPDAVTSTTYTTPPQGTHAWWTGRGDQLNNKLTREIPAAGRVTVSADVWHQIEAGYDYLYAEWSTDGGATWQRTGSPIDGTSRGWVTKRWAYNAGGLPSLFRFRYQTDGGVNEAGAFLDKIAIGAGTAYSFTDGAEAGPNGWTAQGWTISTGTESKSSPRYYLLENRQYVGYDATLKTGPYQFSEAVTRPNWVERFPFQDGMLVWYVDGSYADNNVSAHPGAGSAMVVDARPLSFTYADGTRPSNRRQPFDATFGLDPVDPVCLHKQAADSSPAGYTTYEACAKDLAAMPTFDDSNPTAYWSAVNPQNSVKVAGHGVTATVTGASGGVLTVAVTNPAG